MKISVMATLAVAVIAGPALRAEACNPMLGKNYGKHVAPTTLPASMLARNNSKRAGQATIVGLWHIVHTASNGTLFLEGYDTWNSDGTENELANLPPATGNLCVGAYTRQGKKINLTTHVAWLWDTSNNFVGTLNMTQENKVAADGNSYTGTFDAKFYDTTGTLFQEVAGTNAAERLVQ